MSHYEEGNVAIYEAQATAKRNPSLAEEFWRRNGFVQSLGIFFPQKSNKIFCTIISQVIVSGCRLNSSFTTEVTLAKKATTRATKLKPPPREIQA